MRCVNTKPVGTDPKTGKQLVEAMIIADTEPENLPTTGEGIIGMSESEVFAPFSLIYVLAAATQEFDAEMAKVAATQVKED